MFSNPSSKLLSFSVLILGGALLAGCGGGGSGPAVPTSTPGPTLTPTAPPNAGLILSDEFNANSLDRKKWTPVDNSGNIQRTQFGKAPTFGQDADGTHFMRVTLDTYLPANQPRARPEIELYGTEVAANDKIARGTGVEFQARMRMAQPERTGLVGSFFMFGQKGNFDSTTTPLSFDEIDHELLTNAYADQRPYTWTNIYNDFRVPQKGIEGGDSYTNDDKTKGIAEPLVSGYDPTAWNVYRIVWRADGVQWFINDQPIRTDPSVRVPDDALGVRFNMWAPSGPPVGWTPAWSPSLVPAASAAQNQNFSLDVDWVRVTALDAATTTSSPLRSLSSARLIPMTRAEIMRGRAGVGYKSNARR